MPYESADEFMLRGACLVVDEAQGCTGKQVKEAAKFNSDRAQTLLAVVCAEMLPKRARFGEGERCFVGSKKA